MATPTPRTRRLWTEEEDAILSSEADRLGIQQGGDSNNWSILSTKLPSRTNKDCRKRWLKICKHVNRGSWAPDEDERLLNAVQRLGTRWTEVAEVVETRHADQCAKRWQHVGGFSVAGEPWTLQEDERLLRAVEAEGPHFDWRTIAEQHFNNRSAHEVSRRHKFLADVVAQSATANAASVNSSWTSTPLGSAANDATLDPLLSCGMLDFSASPMGLGAMAAFGDSRGVMTSGFTEPNIVPGGGHSSKAATETTLTMLDVQPEVLMEVLKVLMSHKTKVKLVVNQP